MSSELTVAVLAALDHAAALRAGSARRPPPPAAVCQRRVAIGDPQAAAARFFAALEVHGLLGADGWLRPTVQLVSLGDHFDYGMPDAATLEAAHGPRAAGLHILHWLSAHPPEQVALLLGNHDAARVMEFARLDDARFAAAATHGRSVLGTADTERAEAERAFRAAFPDVATAGYAARDYNAFCVEQRALVRALLLRGRFALALSARTAPALGGGPLLLSHAGVTRDTLALLGLPLSAGPDAIAQALTTALACAIADVAQDWVAGGSAPLSLEPLHCAGANGQEGGGLLYHRPADPDRPGVDRAWERPPRAPRRFAPEALPPGLVQGVGHTGHRKAFKELPRWRAEGLDDRPGGLRTLRVPPDGPPIYQRGLSLGGPGDAVLLMADPEMNAVGFASEVAVLELSPE